MLPPILFTLYRRVAPPLHVGISMTLVECYADIETQTNLCRSRRNRRSRDAAREERVFVVDKSRRAASMTSISERHGQLGQSCRTDKIIRKPVVGFGFCNVDRRSAQQEPRIWTRRGIKYPKLLRAENWLRGVGGGGSQFGDSQFSPGASLARWPTPTYQLVSELIYSTLNGGRERWNGGWNRAPFQTQTNFYPLLLYPITII